MSARGAKGNFDKSMQAQLVSQDNLLEPHKRETDITFEQQLKEDFSSLKESKLDSKDFRKLGKDYDMTDEKYNVTELALNAYNRQFSL